MTVGCLVVWPLPVFTQAFLDYFGFLRNYHEGLLWSWFVTKIVEFIFCSPGLVGIVSWNLKSLNPFSVLNLCKGRIVFTDPATHFHLLPRLDVTLYPQRCSCRPKGCCGPFCGCFCFFFLKNLQKRRKIWFQILDTLQVVPYADGIIVIYIVIFQHENITGVLVPEGTLKREIFVSYVILDSAPHPFEMVYSHHIL